MEKMNSNDQPDQRNGMEEKWRAVFDKIFGELRINHPADEWTLRLVDQLTLKGAEELTPPTPEPVRLVEEIVNKEMINMEAAEKAEQTEEAPGTNEVDQVVSSSPQVDDNNGGQDITDGSQAASTETVELLPVTDNNVQLAEGDNAEVSLNVSQQEKAPEPLDMQRDQPVAEPDNNLVSGHEDNQVDATTAEIQVDQVQVQLHLEASGEATKQGDQGESNERSDEAAEKLQEVETGSSSGLEAQDSGERVEPERENEPILIHNGQETQERHETIVCNEPEMPNCTEQLEPVPNDVQEIPQQEINDTTVAASLGQIESETANGEVTGEVSVTEAHVEEVQTTTAETKDEVEENHITVEDVADAVAEQVEKLIENVDNQEKAEEKEAEPVSDVRNESDAPIETHFDLTTTELPTVIHVNSDQPQLADAEEVKEASTFYEERLIGDQDPPRQVEELEVAPIQVAPARPAQRLGASSPQLASSSNGEGQPKASSSAAKKTPSKSPENELIRKPEWMRRPLVRKGSVGRFLGRMKDTMQSKRFHPDRLPVVPPPQPEPPKRPPRRKTLANLDMSRESETTSQDQSIFQSPPAPATPKSAPITDFESKSATLRSTTSDRKRKNSVGRFIGRVLSTKHLNATEGTAAEEAPLLNQEPPNSVPQSPTTPSTPAPSEKSKKGPAMAMNVAVNDMGVFIRRILRKPAATEESKDKPSPQRPPPPSRHQTPSPNDTTDSKNDQGKPVIKSGKVHFECQTCHHEWKSARGVAKCEIVVHQVGDGIRQGEILVRLYGQQCKRCTSNVFEAAEWNDNGISKVLTDLRSVVGRRFYPDEDEPKAHQKRLCQACQEGVCQSNSSRLN